MAAVLSLLCAGFIWFIFKPDTTETVEGTAGINTTIPDAIAPETMTDKQKAYELERMKDMTLYRPSGHHQRQHVAQRQRRGPAPLPPVLLGPIHLDQRCNHTRWSVLRYPNDAMAQLAGVSTEEYEDFYFRACLVDYDKMGGL
mgnify:CR=1 FL=1